MKQWLKTGKKNQMGTSLFRSLSSNNELFGNVLGVRWASIGLEN